MRSFKDHLDEACWKGYKQIGTKTKNGKEVPNCVPESVKEENDEPASPDEKSMAMDQAKFLAYTAKEIMEYLDKDKEFPEWMQNKLSGLHQKAKDMHSVMAGKYDESVNEGSETWEAGYKRRVVKTTKPEHKEKGYNWRIKGKDRPEISIKLYKEKPSQQEFNKQMKRVAGHEFGG